MTVDTAVSELQRTAEKLGRAVDTARASREIRECVALYNQSVSSTKKRVVGALRTKKYRNLIRAVKRVGTSYEELLSTPNLIDPLVWAWGDPDWTTVELFAQEFLRRLRSQERWLSHAERCAEGVAQTENVPDVRNSPSVATGGDGRRPIREIRSCRKGIGGRPEGSDRSALIVSLGILFLFHTGKPPAFSEDGPFVRFVTEAIYGEIQSHFSANLNQFVKAALQSFGEESIFSFDELVKQRREMERYDRVCGVVEN